LEAVLKVEEREYYDYEIDDLIADHEDAVTDMEAMETGDEEDEDEEMNSSEDEEMSETEHEVEEHGAGGRSPLIVVEAPAEDSTTATTDADKTNVGAISAGAGTGLKKVCYLPHT